MALLEVRELTKDFDGIRAVDHCSFDVEAGTITAVIGPNGAGKTTAFNLITGLLTPTDGKIFFDGANVVGLKPHTITRRGISRTFQITRDLEDMTVLENMIVQSPTSEFRDLFASSILGRERRRALELLDFVGIVHLADEKAKKLSYGQKKLMEFASILMTEPRLIMLDEPAGGVNPALLEQIVDRIQRLNNEGLTVLIVEHNMDVVMNLSDSVVVMAYGKVLTQDTPDVVQRDQAVLDAYLGEA